MAKEITFWYSHREKLEPEGERSHQFFSQFPDVDVSTQEVFKDGFFPAGGPERYYFGYLGTVVLSSATIASVIKTWIQSRRRKIVISISGADKKVEYEGPNFSLDKKDIESMIEKLADEAGDKSLQVSATEASE